jgi:hypothetical protein
MNPVSASGTNFLFINLKGDGKNQDGIEPTIQFANRILKFDGFGITTFQYSTSE